MLVSSAGTFFLLLTASSWLLTEGGSGLGAAAVFGFQWILPVLLVGVIRKVFQSSSPLLGRRCDFDDPARADRLSGLFLLRVVLSQTQ